MFCVITASHTPCLDSLLAFDPLDVEHVKRCNQAEADFWKRNEGYQTKPSDKLLQFDCGGQVRQRAIHYSLKMLNKKCNGSFFHRFSPVAMGL